MASPELEAALNAARAAGEVIQRLYRSNLAVQIKADRSPVTEADLQAERVIRAVLSEQFPGYGFYGEETGQHAMDAENIWLVDPIDGTKDYIRNEDGYSVMIGLVCDGRPTVGVVHQPTLDRTYFATPDGGAHVEHAGVCTPLAVSNVATSAAVRLVASKSHRSADLDRVKIALGIDNELNIGSVGLKLSVIATGTHDLYVNPSAKTKAWDTCAPEAILVRAGGRLSDMFGGPIEYRGELQHRRGLIASNAAVHDEVVQKLGPLFPQLA